MPDRNKILMDEALEWEEALDFKKENEEFRDLNLYLRQKINRFTPPEPDPLALTEEDLMEAENCSWSDTWTDDYFDDMPEDLPQDSWECPAEEKGTEEKWNAAAGEWFGEKAEQKQKEEQPAVPAIKVETVNMPFIVSGSQDAHPVDPDIKEHTLFYRDHITENPALLASLVRDTKIGGLQIQLVAGCGSGKTYFSLCEYQKAVFPDYQIIEATPNRIQTEQNGKYGFSAENGELYSVRVITAGSGQSLNSGAKAASSAVYDSLFRLLSWSDQQLSRVVLVVDEAHLLFEARTYRKDALQTVERIAKRVRSTGGTVILMTGTPAKLGGMDFDRIYRMVKTGDNGQPVPETNISSITLGIKNNKKCSMRDMTAWYAEKLIKEGKKPLIRINQKNDISRIAMTLQGKGYHILTLTSDDKTGESAMYRSIMEHDLLPEADAYLVTSILEVGTSITAVEQNGAQCVPDNMAPVFVVRNPKEMDLDMIRQFWARLRFPCETGYVLFNHCDQDDCSGKVPTLQEEVWKYRKNAGANLAAFSRSCTEKGDSRDMQDESLMTSFLQTDHGYSRDDAGIYADAVVSFYRKAYNPAFSRQMFSDEFRLPVTVEECDPAERMELSAENIPEETKQALQECAANHIPVAGIKYDPKKYGTDDEHVTVQKIEQMPGGREILSKLAEIDPLPFRLDGESDESYWNARMQHIEAAVAVTQNGDMSQFRGLKKAAVKRAILSLQSMEEKLALMLVNYYLKYMENRITDPRMTPPSLNEFLPDYMFKAVSFLWNTDDFRDLMLLAKDIAFTRSTWKDTVCLKAGLSHEGCLYINQQIYAVEWNKLDPSSKMYDVEVDPRHFISGAQYHVLRYPEKCFFEEDPAKQTPLYPDGFTGKTLSKETFDTIASMMNRAVRKAGFTGRNRRYTGDMVKQYIMAIYSFKNRDGKMLILGARKRVMLPVPDAVFEKEAIIKQIDYTVRERQTDKSAELCRMMSKYLRVRLLKHYDFSTARWITDTLNQEIDSLMSENKGPRHKFSCRSIFERADRMEELGIFPKKDAGRPEPYMAYFAGQEELLA